MSGYRSHSSNPFEEEEDFSLGLSGGMNRSPYDDRLPQLHRLVDESEDRQLESTQRAIASLYESEAMGNATAEELLRQREVIQNMEKKTDNISSTLTTSQRHINNIKSVFGGIKNWWSGRKESTNSTPPEQKRSSLDTIVGKNADSALGGGSFSSSGCGWQEGSQAWGGGGHVYQSDADLDSRFMAGAARYKDSDRIPSTAGGSSTQYMPPITGSAREDELDRNLGLMSDGLGRLKMLARGLGDEIDEQNEALDRLNPKVNRANDLLDSQNKQMGKILKP